MSTIDHEKRIQLPRLESEARKAVQTLIDNGKAALHIPPQINDPDVVLYDVISELDDLRSERKAVASTKSVLKRLVRYYGGRARSSRRAAMACEDCQTMADLAVVASRWEAKRDAVLKVAENLQIDLGDKPSEDKEEDES